MIEQSLNEKLLSVEFSIKTIESINFFMNGLRRLEISLGSSMSQSFE